MPDVARSRSVLWPAAVLGSCISVAALGVVALKAIQEQQAIIDELTARLEAIESKQGR